MKEDMQRKIAKLVTEEMQKSDVIDIVKKDKDFEKRVNSCIQ